jgi:hypothetical protein
VGTAGGGWGRPGTVGDGRGRWGRWGPLGTHQDSPSVEVGLWWWCVLVRVRIQRAAPRCLGLVEACLELRQDFQGPLHRIKATFPTGPKNELRWHDGFVFDHNQLEREEGEGVEYQYTLFFPINATDIMKLFPHPSTAKTSASASSTFPTRRPE